MPDTGEFVDSFIAFIKIECRDLWTRWCGLADKVVPPSGVLPEQYRSLFSDANGSTAAQSGVYHGRLFWKGRSKEQAGEMLFSERGWVGQEDFVREMIVYYNLGELETLESDFGERLLAVLHKGALSLKGYTDDLEERTAPPGMITRDALLGARHSNSIVLTNKSKLSGLWLEPAPQVIDQAAAVASQVMAPAAPTKVRREHPVAAADDDQVRQLILTVCIAAQKARTKPPNENDLLPGVNVRLKPKRLKAGSKRVRRLWKEEIFTKYKLQPGQHFSKDFWKSKPLG